MSYAAINALTAIARNCNEELRGVNRKDLVAMRAVTDKHAAKAKLLGYSKIEMMRQIGIINGVMQDL